MAICQAIFRETNSSCKPLRWITMLDEAQESLVLQACTDPQHDIQAAVQQLQLGAKERSHMLTLRGLLALDLLRVCLQKRHNVDYGITDRYASEVCVVVGGEGCI